MLFEFIFQEPVTNFMVVHPVVEDILLKIKNVNVMVLLKGDSGDHQTHSPRIGVQHLLTIHFSLDQSDATSFLASKSGDQQIVSTIAAK